MENIKYDRAVRVMLDTPLYNAAVTSIEANGTFTFADREQGQNKFTGKIVDAKREDGDWITFFIKRVEI